MSVSCFFITLALFGAAAAQYCGSDMKGEYTGHPITFAEINITPGTVIVNFPPVCEYPVGLSVTACTGLPPPPVVEVLDMYRARIYSDHQASVNAVVYCYESAKHGGGLGYGHRHGHRHALAHGFALGAGPAEPLLGAHIGNALIGHPQ